MLGNGLRVVMAWAGEAFVISRGVAQRLEINPATGLTVVTYRTGVPMSSGLTVEVRAEDPDDARYAKLTIALAKLGFDYKGPSSPHWYGYSDFARLFSDAPSSASAADVVADLGPPKTLDRTTGANTWLGRHHRIAARAAATNAACATRQNRPARSEVHQDPPGYKRKSGIRREPAGGHVPYVLEAHVGCKRADKRSDSKDAVGSV